MPIHLQVDKLFQFDTFGDEEFRGDALRPIV